VEWPHTLITVSGQHARPAQHTRQIRQSARRVKFWRKSQDIEIKYFDNFTATTLTRNPIISIIWYGTCAATGTGAVGEG
jgi:hypothetical protein